MGPAHRTAVREEGRLPAIRRFSDAIAAHAGLRPVTLRLTDWREVLSNAPDVTVRSRPPTALQVHAVLGGAPGHRPVAARPHPNDGFASWLTRTLLDPGRAVRSRTETEYLLREDPRITQHTLYYDILTAIAQGTTTPTRIGAALERRRNAVTPPARRPGVHRLRPTRAGHPASPPPRHHPGRPLIRFNQSITLPQAATVEQGFAEAAWQAAAPTSDSKILSPHFEDLVRTFTRRYAHTLFPGGLPGPVGTTEAADPAARTRHEVDVIALAPGERPRAPVPGSPSSARPRPPSPAAAPVTCGAWNASVPCSPIRVTTPRAPPWPCSPYTASTRT
ncbi:hypothetical protein ACH5AO_10780 [Streptomyces sp. NPDC018964]|uniref:hypothetical protein n=1 Tax=Streptomyces sp. NPDC018964 TaxID=3365058 RepID=UPI00379CC0B5